MEILGDEFLRYCTACRRNRFITDFSQRRPDGPYQRTCTPCRNWRRANRARHRNRLRHHATRRRPDHILTPLSVIPSSHTSHGSQAIQFQDESLPDPIGWLPIAGPARVSYYSHGFLDQKYTYCNALHWLHEKVTRSSRTNPTFSGCCFRGDLTLSPFTPLPQFLEDLLLSPDQQGRAVRQRIRDYNNAFAFTSVNCTTSTRGLSNTRGLLDFQIQGILYHTSGPLQRVHGIPPQFAQFYFYNPGYATDLRLRSRDGLDRRFLADMAAYLHQHNPYIQKYLTARERLLASEMQTRVSLTPQLRLVIEEGADRRRENLPTANEVAALIPYEEEHSLIRNIVLAERRADGTVDGWHDVHPTHAAYMPLAYPLIFPEGDNGFHWGLRLNDNQDRGRVRTQVSLRMYAAYILHPRPDQTLIPFAFGRLFQQLVVDLWASAEQLHLSWFRHNQSKIRADLYHQVNDWVHSTDGDARQLGRRVILPAGYIGGDRFNYRCYQNSMAIVRVMQKPDYFITITCNPNWPEIQHALLPEQTASDRPDIVGRVFQMKSNALIEELKLGLFGEFRAIVWTLEFQKRGLPHRHILLFLGSEAKARLRHVENIDRVIRAELPTVAEDLDGVLRAVVESHMVHGPCGVLNPRCPCMEKLNLDISRCSKRFPKEFNDSTVITDDGYPIYRRRDTGERAKRRVGNETVWLDNRWVIPYNPYLSRKYNAHINVEICSNIHAVKYIHKYIYKGSDRATANITTRGERATDEIDVYLQCRYISPAEAIVRIFEFPTHEEWPPVIALPVHLEREQAVYFPEDADARELEAVLERDTPLMAFFSYNQLHVDGRQTLYSDFPSKYVFNAKTRQWVPRVQRAAIGRMLYVPPQAGERWYLRLLLSSFPGATSFTDLRTLDGVTYDTFREACVAAGLVEDDRHWVLCFEEASRWQTGYHLRDLFVLCLLHGDVSQPVILWEQFRHDICDDLPRRMPADHGAPPELSDPWIDYGLYLITRAIEDAGRNAPDFGLPACQHTWHQSNSNRLIQRELAYDREEERRCAERFASTFNHGQRAIFDEIVAAVENRPCDAHFFIQGPGGAGKTFLYRGLSAHYRSQGHIVLCVASSGIAALLLPGGRTAHSRFKIPLDGLTRESVCSVSKASAEAELFRKTHLIIWDEVPMQHKHCFDAVDRTLRDVCDIDSLFGGIPTIFGGDFAQILPVVRHGRREDLVRASIQTSSLWSHISVRYLTENMRVKEADPGNQRFIQWLHDLSYKPTFYGSLELLPDISPLHSLSELCDHIYPLHLLSRATFDPNLFANRSILSARNAAVTEINTFIIRQMPGQDYICLATNVIEDSNQDLLPPLPPEYLANLEFSSIPPSRLQLKIGCPVILLRNLFPERGLCNGTRLAIISVGRAVVQARILTGDFQGQTVYIPKIKLFSSQNDFPYIISRFQFPFRLCFAMTINKSQGQSFAYVGVDLRVSVFTHGQLYVAMSRSTDVRNLRILLPKERPGHFENIVFPEILLRYDSPGIRS